MPTPTRDALATGLLTGFLLIVAFNLQAGWVYAVDALLVGLLVIGFISADLSVRGITIQRQIPQEAFEGEQVPVTVLVSGPRWPRFFVEVVDAVPGLAPHEEFIPLLPRDREIIVTYHTEVRQRGIHQVECIEVRSGGLTGLFVGRRKVPAPGRLTAFPRYWALARFPLGSQTGMSSVTYPQRMRTGLDLYGVREYQHGDSLRHVHWRSTARWGTLMVREFEQEGREAVTLLLDARPEVHGGGGAASAFEDLIRAAASIAHFVTVEGGSVRLLTSHGPVPEILLASWSDALDFLARVRLDGTLSPDELYEAAALPPATPVVILSADSEATAAVIHRGPVVAAVLVDNTSYLNNGASVGNGRRTLLRTLGVPYCVLRQGEDVQACLESCG